MPALQVWLLSQLGIFLLHLQLLGGDTGPDPGPTRRDSQAHQGGVGGVAGAEPSCTADELDVVVAASMAGLRFDRYCAETMRTNLRCDCSDAAAGSAHGRHLLDVTPSNPSNQCASGSPWWLCPRPLLRGVGSGLPVRHLLGAFPPPPGPTACQIACPRHAQHR